MPEPVGVKCDRCFAIVDLRERTSFEGDEEIEIFLENTNEKTQEKGQPNQHKILVNWRMSQLSILPCESKIGP